jgi:hypothetical protein
MCSCEHARSLSLGYRNAAIAFIAGTGCYSCGGRLEETEERKGEVIGKRL